MKLTFLSITFLLALTLNTSRAAILVPACAVISDQQAALYHQQVVKAGMNKVPTRLLLALATYYIYKKDVARSELAEAQLYLSAIGKRKAKQFTHSASCQFAVLGAVLVSKMGNKVKADSLLTQMANLAATKGNYELAAWATYELVINNFPKKTLSTLTRALDFSSKANNRFLRTTIAYELADQKFKKEQYEQGRDILCKYENDFKKLKEKSGRFYSLLAFTQEKLLNHTASLQAGLNSISNYLGVKETLEVGEAYWCVGRAYRNLKKNDDALKYTFKALAIFEKYNDNYKINYAAENISLIYVYLEKNQLAIDNLLYYATKYPPKSQASKFRTARMLMELYSYVNNFEKAEHYRLEIMDSVNKAHNRIGNVDRSLADFFFQFKDYKTSRYYYDSLAAQNTRYHLVYKRLSIIDSAEGNFKGAFTNYKRYKHFTDSLNSTNRNIAIENLRYDFGIKEKDYALALKDAELRLRKNEIKSLQQHSALFAQDAALKEAALKSAKLSALKNQADLKLKDQNIKFLNQQAASHRNMMSMQFLIRNIVIIVVVLCFIVIVLLVRHYKSKQRSEKLLAGQNKALSQLVADKNWLLKEMHHRVKNNLHTVIALLESQSKFLTDDALEAIKISRHRIYAMSLIHQKLYQTDDIKTIDMSIYIPELIDYLKESFNVGKNIRFVMDIQQLELEIYKAVPLGLIINETITNSLKYAFKDRETGTVKIGLTRFEQQGFDLVMADDGIGLPLDYDYRKSNSLGLKLIRGLAKQIDTKLYLESVNGTKLRLSNLIPHPMLTSEVPEQAYAS